MGRDRGVRFQSDFLRLPDRGRSNADGITLQTEKGLAYSAHAVDRPIRFAHGVGHFVDLRVLNRAGERVVLMLEKLSDHDARENNGLHCRRRGFQVSYLVAG